jgi:hypothetical protein
MKAKAALILRLPLFQLQGKQAVKNLAELPLVRCRNAAARLYATIAATACRVSRALRCRMAGAIERRAALTIW